MDFLIALFGGIYLLLKYTSEKAAYEVAEERRKRHWKEIQANTSREVNVWAESILSQLNGRETAISMVKPHIYMFKDDLNGLNGYRIDTQKLRMMLCATKGSLDEWPDTYTKIERWNEYDKARILYYQELEKVMHAAGNTNAHYYFQQYKKGKGGIFADFERTEDGHIIGSIKFGEYGWIDKDNYVPLSSITVD